MNVGIDVLLFNGCSCLWKKPGTSCHNLKPSYVINYVFFLILQIVCPGVVSWIDLKRHKKQPDLDNYEERQIKLQKNESESDSDDDDESESENENQFIITQSGVITADENADLIKMSTSKSHFHLDVNEEEEEMIEFDQTIEIGDIHYNYGWISRLWASLALSDVRSIFFSIKAMCNRFPGESYFTRVQSHDDINWGYGFDIESNSLVGNGLNNADGYQGDIITLHRYLNDYYTGKSPGAFSRGILFGEDLVTGKSRICGRKASLLGLEKALNEKNILLIKMKKKKKNLAEMNKKLIIVNNEIQKAVKRIILLHAVSASIPAIFFIYYGDEVGQLNDYSGDTNEKDTRYLLRGSFDWNVINNIDDDKSHQSMIFNGIKSIIDARLNFPNFTENMKTVMINSYSQNIYYNEQEADDNINLKEKKIMIDHSILIYKRIRKDEKFLIFIFNFCEYKKRVNIRKKDVKGKFSDLIHHQTYEQINEFDIEGYGFLWLEPID